MNRPVRRVLLATGSPVVLVLMLLAYSRLLTARRTTEFSKMMSVRRTLAGALEEFYQTNRAYPATLADLPAGLLEWGEEGSSSADLASWDYSSSTNGFRMYWRRGTNCNLVTSGQAGRIRYEEPADLPPQ